MGTPWKDRNDDGFRSSERTIGCFNLEVYPGADLKWNWHIGVGTCGEGWLATSKNEGPYDSLEDAKKACEEKVRKLALDTLSFLLTRPAFEELLSYGGTD